MKVTNRVLSALLAIIMLIGIVPVSVFSGTPANPDDYTITVKDSASAIVNDVLVEYEIKVNGSLATSNSVSTVNGVAVITDMAAYQTEILSSTDDVTLSYKASKTGYNTDQKSNIPVTVTNDNVDVVLTEETPIVTTSVTVTVNSDENGTVKLNNVEQNSVTVLMNSDVSVEITPADGYQIKSVKIDGNEQITGIKESFSESVIVTADTTIDVSFVKVYTLEVSFNENGTVTSTPNCDGGSVAVEEGETITVTATPDTGYRVSKVVKDGEPSRYNDNDQTYSSTVNADNNHKYEITFAPNQYKINIEAGSNGTATANNSVVDYRGSAVVTISPNTGYKIESVKVNDVETSTTRIDDDSVKLELNDITEDMSVKVTFSKIDKDANLTDVTFDTDFIRFVDGASEKLYVFEKDKTITFTTTKKGIRINGDNSSGMAWKTPTWTISESTTVSKVELFYGGIWHEVDMDKNLRIVIDKTAPDVVISPSAANVNNIYNNDVTCNITVNDDVNNDGEYSGISKVEYWVTSDGVVTQGVGSGDADGGVLYDYYNPAGGSILASFSDSITVDAIKNDSANVAVYIKVTDRAGNEYTDSIALNISITIPTVEVDIDGTYYTGYIYNSERKATITIQDRTDTFDEAAVLEGIIITGKDVAGNPVSIYKAAMLSSWTHSGSKHTATLTFSADANYDWSISYTNKADINATLTGGDGENKYKFTVDQTAPTGSISVGTDTWSELLSTLTFGIWKNSTVTVTAEGFDDTTSLEAIKYYKSDSVTALTKDELIAADASEKFVYTEYTISSDEKFAVYARICDYAGNIRYIGTNGVIVDTTESFVTLDMDAPNGEGFYNSDVNVDISVNEEVIADKAYSGIKTIDYRVESDGQITQSGNLYTFNIANPTYDQLKATWSGNIIVDAGKNNSDNVKVTIIACDNAGNIYEKESDTMAICIDPPEISVEIDGAANKIVEGHGYFAATRVATITIIDRASAFNATAATNGIAITALDAQGNVVTLDAATMISPWSSNGDTHTAIVAFDIDANYEWSIAYRNRADNDSNTDATETATGTTPDKFTVDTTDPSGTITVNHNTWDIILNTLTFGLYSNVKVDVSATAYDATSPVITEYFKTDNPIAMNSEALDNETFIPFEEFSVSSDEQFVVYLKIMDYAGNYIYLNSDGYIVDSIASQITITPDAPNENNIYNKDVKVAIKVADAQPYSGIKTIEYWVENNTVETQRETLYNFDYVRNSGLNSNGGTLTITDKAAGTSVSSQYSGQYPTKEQLCGEWNGTVTVNANDNNSCNVVLYVKTVDNAGNESMESIPLDIDITNPKISVSYNNNNDNNGNGYFDNTRTATIEINERTHHFDAQAATAGIEITAVDAKGQKVNLGTMISSWTTTEGATPDDAVHQAAITYDVDANYTFAISYTDKAGNNNDPVDTLNSVAPYKFTVDTVPPIGTVNAQSVEGRIETWENIVGNLTFGFWSGKSITVTGTSDDATSPVASVQYYKTAEATALKADELDRITEWVSFEPFSVAPNEQFTVYVKITDSAGNYTYISTDGMIVDDNSPREEAIAPGITVSPQQPINGFYNGDVKVSIKVDDPLVGGTYSGLKVVSYRVLNMGVETQSGTLYEFSIANPTRSDLLKTWEGEIVVDSALNNSNDVVIEVYSEDNAANSSRGSVAIKIDTTAPKIAVSYNNNAPDNGKYYKNDRVATIVITERNFSANDVKISITNTGGVKPTVSGWREVKGTGNLNNTTYTATITYHADGDYTFAIAYTDLAGNKCSGATYAGGTTNPTEFTIDQTLPVITVSYDNNSAENGKYFDAVRTGTVTVVEHNFDVSKVVFTQSTNAPKPRWTHNGDTHVATIAYTEDGDYTFDVTMTDLANNQIKAVNYGSSVAAQEFTIDTEIDKPLITGVEDKHAYPDSVIPAISFEDINFDSYTVELLYVGRDGKSVDVNDKFIRGIDENATGFSGTFDTFEMIEENDGIYTLTVNVFDMAGNTESESVAFSVNRFGSTYVMSSSTSNLNGTFAQNPIDVVVTEINPNALNNIKLTLFKNNETFTLADSADYSMDLEGGEGQWYMYTYRIFAEKFEDDGVYRINYHSEDEAGNVSENTLDTKSMEVSFGVDSTPPTLVVTNLESGKTYALENMTVLFSADDNLKLSSVDIYLDDKKYESCNGEELENLIAENNGEFTFDVSGDSTNAHNVEIVCSDAAGNQTNAEFTRFFVTTNPWVRYYNNKPLYFGSIAGGILVAGLIIFFIVWKRKKDDKEEA